MRWKLGIERSAVRVRRLEGASMLARALQVTRDLPGRRSAPHAGVHDGQPRVLHRLRWPDGARRCRRARALDDVELRGMLPRGLDGLDRPQHELRAHRMHERRSVPRPGWPLRQWPMPRAPADGSEALERAAKPRACVTAPSSRSSSPRCSATRQCLGPARSRSSRCRGRRSRRPRPPPRSR